MSDYKPYWMKAPGSNVLEIERQLLHDIAGEVYRRFKERTVIVNIGVSRGASVHCLYAGAPEARHVAIDIDLGLWEKAQSRDLLPGVQWVQADSNDYGLEFEGPVHLLFVDGCHEYDVVWGDIIAWLPHIPVGGIAAFHDYNPSSHDLSRLGDKLRGVKWAVHEWCRDADDWKLADVSGSIAVLRRAR